MTAEGLDFNSPLEAGQGQAKVGPTRPAEASNSFLQAPCVDHGAGAGGSPAKRRIDTGNFVLIGLLLAAIGCLLVLALRNSPKSASADERTDEAQVDQVLSQLNPAHSAAAGADPTSAIVDTFYFQADQRQVPLEELRGNPFVYCPLKLAANNGRDAGKGPRPAEDKGRGARANAIEAVRRLELQSVLKGPRGAAAMISGNLLTEGQAINGWTLKSIRPRQVVLTWKDEQYILTMPR